MSPAPRGLDRLNELPPDEAGDELRRCCGSGRWTAGMVARRPFATVAALLEAADEVWAGLDPEDWREAFSHHPRIGGADRARARFAATRDWSDAEQAGVAGAADAVRDELEAANDAYLDRFGYVFLICAAGKSADDMLARLRARLRHEPEHEIAVAAEEQRKITRLRLDRLISA